MRPRYLFVIIMGLVPGEISRAGILVQQAGLIVDVAPPSMSPITDILLPNLGSYQNAHGVTYFQSYSNAQYISHISGDNFDFHSEAQQHLEGIRGTVENTGAWSVTPTLDSVLTLHGEYIYDHPAGLLGTASVGAQLRVYETNQFVWGGNSHGGTAGLGSSSGHLILDKELPLSAGIKYRFFYGMLSSALDQPGAGQAFLGDGFYDISIRPVPEPAALLPLALSAFLSLAPSRRSRRAKAATPPAVLD